MIMRVHIFACHEATPEIGVGDVDVYTGVITTPVESVDAEVADMAMLNSTLITLCRRVKVGVIS